jgi:putative aminopeptidase FrvX
VKQREVDKMGVHVGCVTTYREFMILNDNKFVCRALSNRMGFMIAEVSQKTLNYGLYITNSVPEE